MWPVATSSESAPPGVGLLGLQAPDAASLIREVRTGFGVSALGRLSDATRMTRKEVSRFAGIPLRSLSRSSASGRLSPEQSDRLLRASRLFEQALSVFDDDVDAAHLWLRAPARSLGGETPMEVAATEVGAREVERVLGRLEHGVFT